MQRAKGKGKSKAKGGAGGGPVPLAPEDVVNPTDAVALSRMYPGGASINMKGFEVQFIVRVQHCKLSILRNIDGTKYRYLIASEDPY